MKITLLSQPASHGAITRADYAVGRSHQAQKGFRYRVLLDESEIGKDISIVRDGHDLVLRRRKDELFRIIYFSNTPDVALIGSGIDPAMVEGLGWVKASEAGTQAVVVATSDYLAVVPTLSALEIQAFPALAEGLSVAAVAPTVISSLGDFLMAAGSNLMGAYGVFGVASSIAGVPIALPQAPAAAPGLVVDTQGSLKGLSGAGVAINDRHPGALVGPLPAGVTGVVLYVDGVQVPATYDAQTGLLSPVNALPDSGLHTLSYAFQNAAGLSAPSPVVSFVIDVQAPAIVIQSVRDADGDGLPEITGSGAEPGAVVTIVLPDGQKVTTVADAMGHWAVELTSLPTPAAGVYSASSADAAGNLGTTTFNATDVTGPSIAIASVNDSDGDGLPAITGTGAEPNALVTITLPDGSTVTTTANASGQWTLELTSLPTPATGIYTASSADAAGNLGNTTFNATDVTGPAIAITSVNDADGDGLPTLTGAGAAPNGLVTISLPDGSTVTTTANASGQWTLELASAPAPLTGTYAASSVDAAGNLGTTSLLVTDLSAPALTITTPANVFDSTPLIQGTSGEPDGTVVQVSLAGSVWLTTVSGGGWSVNTESPVSSGPPFAPLTTGVSAVVSVQIADAAGNVGVQTESITLIAVPSLPDGTPRIALVPEAAGHGINRLEAADGSWVLVDITGSTVVEGNALRVYWGSGNALNGWGVGDGRYVDHVLTAADLSSGLVRVEIPETLITAATADGSRNAAVDLYCQFLDQPGGTGGLWSEPALRLTVDREDPAATPILDFIEADSGLNAAEGLNGWSVNIEMGSLTGSKAAVAGDSLRISFVDLSGVAHHFEHGFSGQEAISSEVMSLQISSAFSRSLADGVYDVQTAWVDRAGNIGTIANFGSVHVDQHAPASPLVSLLEGAQVDASEHAAGLHLVTTWGAGTSAGDRWLAEFRHAATGQLIATASGLVGDILGETLLIDPTSSSDYASLLNSGNMLMSVVVSDGANNASAASAPVAVVFQQAGDMTAPSAPTIDPVGAMMDNTPLLTGTWDPLQHSELILTLDDGMGMFYTYSMSAGQITTDGNRWSLVVPDSAPLQPSDWAIVVTGSDAAGNTSSDSGGLTIVKQYLLSDISGDSAYGTGYQVYSSNLADRTGATMSAAGDVDGDGYADYLVGVMNDDFPLSAWYLVWGRPDADAMANLALGPTGTADYMRLSSDGDVGAMGGMAMAAGDVNGDGFGDMILSSYQGSGALSQEYAMVVFGSGTRQTDMLLSDVFDPASGLGFAIDGSLVGSKFGLQAGALGDLNGDGLDDVFVTNADVDGAFIVWGKTDSNVIDASAGGSLSSPFTKISTTDSNGQTYSEMSLTAVGDTNRDGFADFVLSGRDNLGNAGMWMVHGQGIGDSNAFGETLSLVDLETTPSLGYRMMQVPSGFEATVGSTPGDVNGDGYSDWVVNSSSVGFGLSPQYAGGMVWVMKGGPDASSGQTSVTDVSPWDAVSQGFGANPNGFVIENTDINMAAGLSHLVANFVGDINGDGRDDIMLGDTEDQNSVGTGRLWVVYGRTDSDLQSQQTPYKIDLDDIEAGRGGFVIPGSMLAKLGFVWHGAMPTFGTAGDIDGDGIDDLLFSAPDLANYAAPGTQGVGFVMLSSVSYAFQGSGSAAGFDPSLFKASVPFTAGNDQIAGLVSASGVTQDETLMGGNGNDLITTNGGVDLVFGGAGDDRIVFGAADLRDRYQIAQVDNRSRTDGGSGMDTLALASDAVNLTLDLTGGAWSAGLGLGAVSNIEVFDIRGAGNNVMAMNLPALLAQEDSLDQSHARIFGQFDANDPGNPLLNSARRQYMILGDRGDQLLSSPSAAGLSLDAQPQNWLDALAGGTLTGTDGKQYRVFNSVGFIDPSDGSMGTQNAVQLLVSAEMFQPVVPVGYDLAGIRDGSLGFVMYGSDHNGSGQSVSSVGDFNGDGLSDVVAWGYNLPRFGVVFGDADRTAATSMSAGLGTEGVNIHSPGLTFWSSGGLAAESLGDTNGDGFGDFIIGRNHDVNPVAAHVVMGRAGHAEVDLSRADLPGYDIYRPTPLSTANDLASTDAAAAGDMNADGIVDMVIGLSSQTRTESLPGNTYEGRSFVVFGKTDSTDVMLDDLAAGGSGQGFEMVGPQGQAAKLGVWTTSAGDFNNDGYDDVLVAGAQGKYYLVFGSASAGQLDLTNLANDPAMGKLISTPYGVDGFSNYGVGAGDMNGDGVADLAFASSTQDAYGNWNSTAIMPAGGITVLWGGQGSAAVSLGDVAAQHLGMTINGLSPLMNDLKISRAGDVNGDGIDDLIVGLASAMPNAVTGVNEGAAYVVYGSADKAAVNLSDVARGIGGFAIAGAPSAGSPALFGVSVSSGGDVDGDGLVDLLIGDAQATTPGVGPYAGAGYVLLSSRSYAVDGTSELTQYGTASNDVLNGTAQDDRIAAGQGNDILLGGGGVDVLYGGAGDDVISITASSSSELLANLNATHARIDGGAGFNTLALEGDGLTLDLTQVSNLKVQNIQKIDLSGASNSAVTLNLSDLLDMSEAQAGGGRLLIVDGVAGNVLNLSADLTGSASGGWVAGASTTADGAALGAGYTYWHLASGSTNQLMLELAVQNSLMVNG